VLVLNAGLVNVEGRTADGFEVVMGTNYLGHFYLVKVSDTT
jgi:NAD(P)-dependent dehydrogenase (short-subunit alcohol dehydrogenase family)